MMDESFLPSEALFVPKAVPSESCLSWSAWGGGGGAEQLGRVWDWRRGVAEWAGSWHDTWSIKSRDLDSSL